jgi:hypothetical protein
MHIVLCAPTKPQTINEESGVLQLITEVRFVYGTSDNRKWRHVAHVSENHEFEKKIHPLLRCCHRWL